MKGTSLVSSRASTVDSTSGKSQSSSSQGSSTSDVSGAQFFDELLSILATSDGGGDGFTSGYRQDQLAEPPVDLSGFQLNFPQGSEAMESAASSGRASEKNSSTEIGATTPERGPAPEAQQDGKSTTQSEVPAYAQGSMIFNSFFWPIPVQPENYSSTLEMGNVANGTSAKSKDSVKDSSAAPGSGSPAPENQDSSNNVSELHQVSNLLIMAMTSCPVASANPSTPASTQPSSQASSPGSVAITQSPSLKASSTNAPGEMSTGSAADVTTPVSGTVIMSSLNTLQELLSGTANSQPQPAPAEQSSGDSNNSAVSVPPSNHSMINSNSANNLRSLEAALLATNGLESSVQDPVSVPPPFPQTFERQPASVNTFSGAPPRTSNPVVQNSASSMQSVANTVTRGSNLGTVDAKVLSASEAAGSPVGSQAPPGSAPSPQGAPPAANINQNATQSQEKLASSAVNNSQQSAAGSPGQQKGTASGSDDAPARSDGTATAIPATLPTLQKSDISFKQTLSSAPSNQADIVPDKNTTLIAQSIVREAKMITQDGRSVVNLKLEPESLGSVELQVTSDGDKISAQFNVKTADARAYLESSVPEIRQSLQTNGISVSHLTVSLSGDGTQSSYPQYRWTKPQQKFSTIVPTESEENIRNFGYNTMEKKL